MKLIIFSIRALCICHRLNISILCVGRAALSKYLSVLENAGAWQVAASNSSSPAGHEAA